MGFSFARLYVLFVLLADNSTKANQSWPEESAVTGSGSAPAYTLTCTRYRDMQFAMAISPRGARNFNCPHTVWEQKNGGKSHSHSPQMCFRAFAFRLGQAQTHTNFGPQCPRLPLDLLNLPKPTNDRWARPFDSSHRFQLNGHGQERLDLFMARPRRESFVLGPRHQMSFFSTLSAAVNIVSPREG